MWDERGREVLLQLRVDLTKNLSIHKGSLLIAELQQKRFLTQEAKERVYHRSTTSGRVGLLLDDIQRNLTTEKFVVFVNAVGEENQELKEKLTRCYDDGEWRKAESDVAANKEIISRPMLTDAERCKDALNCMRVEFMKSLTVGPEENEIISDLRRKKQLSERESESILSVDPGINSARVECFIDTLIRGMTMKRFLDLLDALRGPNEQLAHHLKDSGKKCGLSINTRADESECDVGQGTQATGSETSTVETVRPSEEETRNTPGLCKERPTKTPMLSMCVGWDKIVIFYARRQNDLLRYSFEEEVFDSGIRLPERLDHIDEIHGVTASLFLIRSGNCVYMVEETSRDLEEIKDTDSHKYNISESKWSSYNCCTEEHDESDCKVTCTAVLKLKRKRRNDVFGLLIGYEKNCLRLLTFNSNTNEFKEVQEMLTVGSPIGLLVKLPHVAEESKLVSFWTTRDITICEGKTFGIFQKQTIPVGEEIVACNFLSQKEENRLAVLVRSDRTTCMQVYAFEDNGQKTWQKQTTLPLDGHFHSPVKMYWRKKDVLYIAFNKTEVRTVNPNRYDPTQAVKVCPKEETPATSFTFCESINCTKLGIIYTFSNKFCVKILEDS